MSWRRRSSRTALAWLHRTCGVERRNTNVEELTKNNTADLFTEHRERSRSQGNFDLESWMVRMVTTESFRTALPVEQGCKYSQFQQSTGCSRQHISPTTSKTTWVCLDATLGVKAHRWVQVNTLGTPMPAREGRGLPKCTTKRQQAANKTQTLTWQRSRFVETADLRSNDDRNV